MNNVFHMNHLCKASDNPLPGQALEPEPLIKINGKPEYEVEKILSSCIHNSILQYKVYWSEYDSDDQWYNANGFIRASIKIKKYYDKNSDKTELLIWLSNWLAAYVEGKDLEPTSEDNLVIKAGIKSKARWKK